MPENNAEVSKEPKPQDTSVGIDKSAAETPTTSNDRNQTAPAPATKNVTATDTSSAKAATESPAPPKRLLSFKKFVPLLVLLLAAGILFGIIGGLDCSVGAGSPKNEPTDPRSAM